MKRILAFLMTISVFCISFFIDSTISFASELSIIVEKEEYQEITDPYKLLELAIQQKKMTQKNIILPMNIMIILKLHN